MELLLLRSVVASIAFIAVYIPIAKAYDDKPCDAVPVFNRSVICKCTASYCDTIIREVPAKGEIITYTSSDSGLRFHKESSSFKTHGGFDGGIVLTLDPETKYQTINGFGGGITDATGLNWQNLTDPQLKQHLINSYCSDKGIEYTMLRVPIGGSDFSTRYYAYNEYPEGDTELSNFTLSYEDLNYKLPFIKACMEVAKEEVHVVASCWSPPTWMKILHNFTGVNYLRPEYYQIYANYYTRFVEEYEKYEVPVWGVTPTNEPITGLVNLAPINSLGWTVTSMAIWLADHLGPTIKKRFPKIKLLAVDDQRNTIPIWLNSVASHRPDIMDFVDGVGVHFYYNDYVPAEIITQSLKQFPNLFVLATEASQGGSADINVDWGSWDRGAYYAKNIIDDLNVNVIGWMDWNMVLNSQGGPVLNENYCDSPIIAMPEEGAFYKQPMFYAMGHFAKFLPRGSNRIKLETSKKSSVKLYSVAALTPSNTIVVVLNNWETHEIEVTLKLGHKYAKVTLPASSIVTAEFAYDKLALQ